MNPIQVVLVTSPGCHFCDEAQHMLVDLNEGFPLDIVLVPLTSDEGRALVLEHRVPFPPILMVEGTYFGYGRISRRRLEQRLAQLSAVKAAG